MLHWLLLSQDARQARLLKAEAKLLLFTKSIDIAQELFSVRTPVWKAPVEEFCPELETRPSARATRPQRWPGLALNPKWAVLEAIIVRSGLLRVTH